MTKKKFMNEFATTIEQIVPKDIDDYDEFQDKDLLEKLRNKIIQKKK